MIVYPVKDREQLQHQVRAAREGSSLLLGAKLAQRLRSRQPGLLP